MLGGGGEGCGKAFWMLNPLPQLCRSLKVHLPWDLAWLVAPSCAHLELYDLEQVP